MPDAMFDDATMIFEIATNDDVDASSDIGRRDGRGSADPPSICSAAAAAAATRSRGKGGGTMRWRREEGGGRTRATDTTTTRTRATNTTKKSSGHSCITTNCANISMGS